MVLYRYNRAKEIGILTLVFSVETRPNPSLF